MSAIKVFHPLSEFHIGINPRLFGQALILPVHLPSIFVTLLGVAALSMYWAVFVLAVPGTLSVAVSVIVQLMCLILLIHAWPQNTHSPFRKSLSAINGLDLRSHAHP